jgi:hypothetical protein
MARIRNALAEFVALLFVGGLILPTQATAATVTYTVTGIYYNFTVTNDDPGWTINEIVVTPARSCTKFGPVIMTEFCPMMTSTDEAMWSPMHVNCCGRD